MENALSMDDALNTIRQQLTPISDERVLGLKEALGGVLTQAVVSPIDVPAHRNSAMDGYAFSGADLPAEGIAELRLVGTAFAGKPFKGSLNRGECVRIMTGAKMPEAADTVVIQEQAELEDGLIRVDNRNKQGQNVRQAGEDIPQGSEVLSPGTVLGAPQLGLLASLGISSVAVGPPVRVACFSSGDEIKGVGETLSEGQIFDSNRYTLFAMLRKLGVDVVDLGIVEDKQDTITDALREAAASAHLVLTSGGVSVGEADYIAAALRDMGTCYFSKVAIKPGRPLTFGRIKGTPFFGLPGNPVAVMITFLQFVVPAIQSLRGEQESSVLTMEAVCQSNLRKSPGRTEFQRGILEFDAAGTLSVRTTGRQGSGVLSSMNIADCFILLAADRGSVSPGETVTVQPFACFPGL